MNSLKEYYGELESLRFEVLIEDGYKKCRSLHHYFLPWQSTKEYEKELEIKRMEAENEIFLLSDSQQKMYFDRLNKFFDSLSQALQSITYHSNGEYLLKKDNTSLADCLKHFRLYNENVGSCNSGVIFEDLQTIILVRAASVNKMLPKYLPGRGLEPLQSSNEVSLAAPAKKPKPGPRIILQSDQVKQQIVDTLRPYLSNVHAEYLSDILEGKDVPEKIQFNGAANQIAEFFKRMLYNQKILNPIKGEVEEWLCKHFLFYFSNKKQFQDLNSNTVHDCISKGRAEPKPPKRIPASWMVYKKHSQLKSED